MKSVGFLSAYALGLVLIAGCGGGGPPRVPVAGQVTLDGASFSGGILHFVPDTAKGNKHRVAGIGPVQSGKYNLRALAVTASEMGMGIPTGWYKAYLETTISGQDLKIAPKFTTETLTPISIEVVENPAPGAYDIKFTSK